MSTCYGWLPTLTVPEYTERRDVNDGNSAGSLIGDANVLRVWRNSHASWFNSDGNVLRYSVRVAVSMTETNPLS